MRAFIIMGAAGAGKSTVASLMAERFSLPFLEGDNYHPPANVEKMSAGVPLTNADRGPWIASICNAAEKLEAQACVVSCSALNEKVRAFFTEHFSGDITYIYLCVSKDELLKRMTGRKGHFMPAALLNSQLAALSPPAEGYKIDADKPLSEVIPDVTEIISGLLSADERR